jgi:ATP-binding cassette subfamily A (ABC1) protein 3
MFLKRFYNSLRFYVAIVTQLGLPLVFMLLALILIKIPNTGTGELPRRVLTLHNSALSGNVTAFWAQFGDPPPHFDFSNATAAEISASKLWDYTDRVRAIRESIHNFSAPTDCCSYTYQLLDKFCASLTSGDYRQSCKGTYNYKECPDCLMLRCTQ